VKTSVTEPPPIDVEPTDLEYLINEGIVAREMGDQSNWRLGDLALKVETRPGEYSLERYAKRIGVGYASLRVYKSVAAAYPEPVNRLTSLSWTHHLIVAARPNRADRLAEAARERWSVADMRKHNRPAKTEQLDYDAPAERCEACHQTLPRQPDETRPEPAAVYPDPDGWYRAHWTNRVDKFGDRIPAAIPADLSHALWTLNANRNVYTATFYYTSDSRPRNVQQIVTNPNYVSRAPAAAGWRTGRNFHDRPSGWEQPPKVQRAYKKWAATPLGLRRDGAGTWEVPEEYDRDGERLTWEADPMPHKPKPEFDLNPKTRPKGYRPNQVSPIDTSERDRVFAEWPRPEVTVTVPAADISTNGKKPKPQPRASEDKQARRDEAEGSG
jgi:hypothetical protein